MTEGYGSLAAELYDLSYPIGTSFGDVEFYRDRLCHRAERVLEPAVGTGRVLLPLLDAGLNVDGYDLSTAMLTVCRRHCAEHGRSPSLFEADMVRHTAPDTYDAVILPSGSFALLEDLRDAEAALACFRTSLVPGGRIIVDVEPPPFAPDARPSRVQPGPEDLLVTMDTLSKELDPVRQVCVRYLRYEKWRHGAWRAAEVQRFALRWYGLDEFRRMLDAAGFTNIRVSGDYRHGTTPDKSSAVWTYEAARL